MRYAPPLTPAEIAHVRKLRYQDGLSLDRVAALTGRNRDTISRHAPGDAVSGRRVPAQPIRDAVQAYVATGATSWSALARHLGMTSEGGVVNCPMCESEAEELRVVGPDHRNTADYTGGSPRCPDCDAVWPPRQPRETCGDCGGEGEVQYAYGADECPTCSGEGDIPIIDPRRTEASDG